VEFDFAAAIKTMRAKVGPADVSKLRRSTSMGQSSFRTTTTTTTNFTRPAMAVPPSIEYTPLPPSGVHIHILSLHPRNVQDRIHCGLRTVSLDDEPAYDALSYSWDEHGITE
jgi:hypothetical protein